MDAKNFLLAITLIGLVIFAMSGTFSTASSCEAEIMVFQGEEINNVDELVMIFSQEFDKSRAETMSYLSSIDYEVRRDGVYVC